MQSESDSQEEKQKKKRSEISREAKAKKALNAKATKDALLKRRLQQAKEFKGYKSTKTSANSGACSQEVLPNDVSDAASALHVSQDEDYPSQFSRAKATNEKLPASRTTVPNKAGTITKEAKKRKKPGRMKPRFSNNYN